MYKVLITTMYWTGSSGSVHTVVVEFNSITDALCAVDAVVATEGKSKHPIRQTALLLNGGSLR